MTQVGEGRDADEAASPVMTFGAPTLGEILAERYELAEHVNDDSAGRQVWRGVDVVLRRPVAVVLRYPGGESATEMLQAAVTASRVIHPNLVGVYDAIDEGDRAYVVREWVDGDSLREMVAEEVLEPARATSIAHAVAGAVAAVHATGMVHGNVHPGTVLVGHDGRVVLADARADGAGTPESDVRAIGGILYFSLTGHWPHAETGKSALPDAVRDASGTLAAPRQVRAGVPAYLDDLTMDLLDTRLAPPASDVLAAELGRLDTAAEEQYLDEVGSLRFAAVEEETAIPPKAAGRKIAVGVAGLLAIAVAGLFFGISALGNNGHSDPGAGSSAPAGLATPGAEGATPAAQPKEIPLSQNQVRVVDPDGKRDEFDKIELAVDGDPNTGWKPDRYNSPKFGNIKRGMGVLIDLKEPRDVTSLQVVLSANGASAQLFAGVSDPGSSAAGDKQVLTSFSKTPIGEPYDKYNGTNMTFSGFSPDRKYQYLLFWITEMPKADDGRYQVGVQEIEVQGR